MLPESIETKLEVSGTRLDQERKKLLHARYEDSSNAIRVSDSQQWEEDQLNRVVNRPRYVDPVIAS